MSLSQKAKRSFIYWTNEVSPQITNKIDLSTKSLLYYNQGEIKMAITRLNTHDTHPTSIHLCQQPSKHYAALRCVTCDKHIQWLSKQAVELLQTNEV